MCLEHIRNGIQFGRDADRTLIDFRKHLGWYTKGLPGGENVAHGAVPGDGSRTGRDPAAGLSGSTSRRCRGGLRLGRRRTSFGSWYTLRGILAFRPGVGQSSGDR